MNARQSDISPEARIRSEAENAPWVPPGYKEDISMRGESKTYKPADIPSELMPQYDLANQTFEQRWADIKQITPAMVEESIITIEDPKTKERYQTWPEKALRAFWSAITLPGDVWQGKVDPASEESLQRAFDLAGVLTFGTMPLKSSSTALTYEPGSSVLVDGSPFIRNGRGPIQAERGSITRQGLNTYYRELGRNSETQQFGRIPAEQRMALRGVEPLGTERNHPSLRERSLRQPSHVGELVIAAKRKGAILSEKISPYKSENNHMFVFQPKKGSEVHLGVNYDPVIKDIYIDFVTSNVRRANTQGLSETRNLLRMLQEVFPEAKTITGFRISGARRKSGSGSANASMRLN